MGAVVLISCPRPCKAFVINNLSHFSCKGVLPIPMNHVGWVMKLCLLSWACGFPVRMLTAAPEGLLPDLSLENSHFADLHFDTHFVSNQDLGHQSLRHQDFKSLTAELATVY